MRIAPAPAARRLFATLFAALGLLASHRAEAGGIGLIGTGGMHADRVYGYNGDVQAKPEEQMNANYGTGLELTLGDRDNRISGIFRFYWLEDGPQSPPKNGDGVNYAIRTGTRDVGMFAGGLQWGLVGDPTRIQLTAVTLVGSGFLTNDFTEFAIGEAGIGGTFNATRHLQVFAEATGGIRYRKRVFPTVNGTLGVRYLFD